MSDTPTPTHALATPELEPELSVREVGSNRIRLLQRFSNAFENAPTQMWLVEKRADSLEFRLGYWYPPLSEAKHPLVRGAIVTEKLHIHATDSGAAPASLVRLSGELFSLVGAPEKNRYEIPIVSPIPSGDESDQIAAPPLAWIVTAHAGPTKEQQTLVIEALAFNLAILLERDRAQRLSRVTTQCTEVLYSGCDPKQSLLIYATKLIESCGARIGGVINYVSGLPKDVEFVPQDVCDAARKEVLQLLQREHLTVPTISEYLIETHENRERQTGAEIGNFLFVPIISVGLCLIQCEFTALGETGEIGLPCDFVNHALFAAHKFSAGYLGNNFSKTDREICKRLANSIAISEFPKSLENHFLAQARYFSQVWIKQRIDFDDTVDRVKAFLPDIISLVPIDAYRDMAGKVQIEISSTSEASVEAGLVAVVRKRAIDVLAARGDPEIKDDAVLEYACYITDDDTSSTLIFQAPTRFTPLRYYAVKLGTRIVERSQIQLLVHFVRELFQFQRAKDIADERASILAQIRHAVIDPLAAATNNIDTYSRRVALRERSEDGWKRLKDDRSARDLITQASYLNHQALLFIDTGRFLFSSLEYGKIKFEQYRPLDLFKEVRLAFDHGFKQRQQSVNLKVIGTPHVAVGDSDLLWIAVANLIDNANKYGHRGTEIVITLQFEADRWVFTVENSGDYLDPTAALELYKPFVRGHSSNPAFVRRQGTGLGLAVTQMILKAHVEACDVSFKSKKLENENRSLTRFSFELPYRIAK